MKKQFFMRPLKPARVTNVNLNKPCTFLELPDKEEIAVSEEVRSDLNPAMIIKKIRYKTGLTLVLIQDFQDRIFKIEVRSGQSMLFFSRNQVMRID